jgi:deoxyribose-phosphate aldolase
MSFPPWLPAEAEDWPGLARTIDLSLLGAEAGPAQVRRLCGQALMLGTAAVCVNGAHVVTAARQLHGSRTRVAATVGFPLGAATLAVKRAEARIAVEDGATELDMVMAIGLAKSGEWTAVEEDIAGVVEAARGHAVKVILETAALTRDEILRACQAAQVAGARFVKTSTGFHTAGGATAEAVALLREAVGLGMGVKAAGGIRTCGQIVGLLRAGADRIGISSVEGLTGCVGQDAPRLGDLLAG